MEAASEEMMRAVEAQNGPYPNTMVVEFYRHASIDERKTHGWIEQKFDPNTGMPGPVVKHPGEGGTFFRNAVWVRIRAPGEKDEIREREAREIDKIRHEKAWQRFCASEAGLESGTEGTPLDVLPFVTKAQILEFQAMGIKTAEHLAGCSDVNGQKFMDFQRVRQRTKDFLAAAAGNAPLQEMRAELEERDAQIKALQDQMKQIVEAQTKKK